MGLWMNQSVRREINGVDYVEGKTARKAMLDHKVGFDELCDLCREAEPFEPTSMCRTIASWCPIP